MLGMLKESRDVILKLTEAFNLLMAESLREKESLLTAMKTSARLLRSASEEIDPDDEFGDY
jgi:hypothetical protein